ncbi:cell division inhibitor SepF [Bacillus oleivorans]|uniref:Cell division protein SepF n=1 Tax=Bacillus oleivorans TaxID=1448271 RepID=A0A285D0Z7_9BACI|nr:cell division protein SepF [Bacillus oleivorans]SNX73481.1 cell division inhibitor SepF [Bacillus oleivorans]
MSLKNKLRQYFFYEEDEVQDEVIAEEEGPTRQTRHQSKANSNIVSLPSSSKSSRLVLAEPRMYAEAQEIADHLKNRRAVVINLQRISHEQAIRIVDFLSGTVYAIGGDIQRIGTKIFLCTPDNVEVSGSISEMLGEPGNYQESEDVRWL